LPAGPPERHRRGDFDDKERFLDDRKAVMAAFR